MNGRWLAVLLPVAALGCSSATDSPPRELREEEVRFASGTLELRGTFVLPPEPRRVPAVVVVGGSGPVNRDGRVAGTPLPPIYRHWSEVMARAGIAVLRFDKRFLTHPPADPLALTQKEQIEDVAAAVRYVRARPEVDPERVFVVGHSEGANLAAAAAAGSPDIRGVVAVAAPGFAVDSLVLMQLRAAPGVTPGQIAQVEQAFRQLREGGFPPGGQILGAGEVYWREWIGHSQNAGAIALGLRRPVLVVQGLRDENFPGAALSRNVQAWQAAAAASPLVELKSYEGVTHGVLRAGTAEVAREVIDDVAAWILGH